MVRSFHGILGVPTCSTSISFFQGLRHFLPFSLASKGTPSRIAAWTNIAKTSNKTLYPESPSLAAFQLSIGLLRSLIYLLKKTDWTSSKSSSKPAAGCCSSVFSPGESLLEGGEKTKNAMNENASGYTGFFYFSFKYSKRTFVHFLTPEKCHFLDFFLDWPLLCRQTPSIWAS